MAGDIQSYLDAAPLPHPVSEAVKRKYPLLPVMLAVAAAHLSALFWAMRDDGKFGFRDIGRPIEVALIEPPQARPVPELQKASPALRLSPFARRPAPSVSANPAPQIAVPTAPSVTLFNPDGSLRLPLEAKPQKGLPEPDIAKGRELMSRGLDCEAPDALGSGESLGESVARKYLSWIGMYNPYSAQRRAELLEERKQRCKRWRGQS
jgi:hypothetical protein